MTASAQQPIATSSLTSTNTAYTTLESLLLFHNLSTHGTHPSSFSVISNLLVKNPLVRESDSFDRGRLSPDALREFYLYLLRREEATGSSVNGAGIKSANGSNGGVGDSVDTASFTRQMRERFFTEYRERMRILIRADEDRYTRLAEEIKEIEAGKWDDRLHVHANGVSGDGPRQQSTQINATPLSPTTEQQIQEIPQPNDATVPPPPELIPKPVTPPPIHQGPAVVLPFAPSAEEVKPPLPPPPSQVQARQPTPPVTTQPTLSSPPPSLPQQSPPTHQSPQRQQSPAQQHTPLQQQPPQPMQQFQLQNLPQHATSPTQPSIPRAATIQSPPSVQSQSQNTPQNIPPPPPPPPQPTTPSRQAFHPITSTPYPPVNHGTMSPPLPGHAYPAPQFSQFQSPIPRQTLPPPIPHPQTPYRIAAGYGQQPHGHSMGAAGTNISLPYQQLPQLVSRGQQGHDLHRMQQYHSQQQQQGQQLQHQFPPIHHQPQQVQLPSQTTPSQTRLQSPPRLPKSPCPLHSPPSSQTPPQVVQQPQNPPQNLKPPSPAAPPKSPKHRPPPIRTDVLPLAVPPPEQLQRQLQALPISLQVQVPKAEVSNVTNEEQRPSAVPQSPTRPGSPIQPRPDEISPISTPGSSPGPPAFSELEPVTGKKRSFVEDVGIENVQQNSPVQSDPHAMDIDEVHTHKRRKSMAPVLSSPGTPITSTSKPRSISIPTAADRTAAARAASAAKRAAAKLARTVKATVVVPSESPADTAEPDVKKERESDTEGPEEDIKMGEDEVDDEGTDDKKAVKRRKPGKKRRSVGKRRQSMKKNTAHPDEEDKDETTDDVSTVESEATVPTAVDGEEDVSDMDVEMEGTPTPKGRGQTKRKRQGSTPPPMEDAKPVPTASPRLSATPIAPPPPPLVQTKSDESSLSSSLSTNIGPSPSPASLIPPRSSTVGQQVHVIATKKFQQLSAPLLHNISAHRFANLFMAPVGERVAPGYSRLVYRPMDLKTIKAAIKNGAAAVNQLTAANANSNINNEPPTTPSTPSSSTFAPTGQGYSSHPATTLITPPKGIVNSAQLEKELFRMFANAVMYNKSNTEIVKETVEMGKEVERWVGEFRSAERVGGERARAGGSVTTSGVGGWRGGHRQSISAASTKAESVANSNRSVVRKGKEKSVETKEKDTKRRLSGRQKKDDDDEGQEQEQDDEQGDGNDKMEEDGGEEAERDEDDDEGEGDDDGDEDGDGDSATGTNEAEDDEDDDGKSVASSVGGSTTRAGAARRGGVARGGRRGVKRGKRRR